MSGALVAVAPDLDVIVEAGDWVGRLGGGSDTALEDLAEASVWAALTEAGFDLVDDDTAPMLSLAVLLTDDAEISALNQQFRGKASPTNVLSWPSVTWTEPMSADEVLGQMATLAGHLGDVALALGVCAREASEQGKSLEDHIRHLIIHGVLHLLGYDHQDEEQAAVMESREKAALAALGVADPYAGA